MPTYGMTVLHLPASISLSSAFVNGICGTIGCVLGGILADHYGRFVVVIAPRVLLMAALWPALMLINVHANPTLFLSLCGAFSVVQTASGTIIIVLIPYCFPPAVRTAGLSFGYALAVAIFGGTAQVVFTWLISITGDPLSPFWYIVLLNLLTIASVWAMPNRWVMPPGRAQARQAAEAGSGAPGAV
jgi:nitrate/nitrite transporter NarK